MVAVLLRLDLHHPLDIVPTDDRGLRIGTYVLDTSNHYGGRTPWVSLEYDRATLTLVSDPSPQALPLLLSAPPGSGARVWLEPWVLSPIGSGPLELGRRLLHAFIARRQGVPEEFERHERASGPRVAEFEATFGWHYLGVFKAHGLDPEMRADLYAIDAGDGADALRRSEVEEPADVSAIHEAAKAFVDPMARRFQLWMTPDRLAEAAATEVCIGAPVPP